MPREARLFVSRLIGGAMARTRAGDWRDWPTIRAWAQLVETSPSAAMAPSVG